VLYRTLSNKALPDDITCRVLVVYLVSALRRIPDVELDQRKQSRFDGRLAFGYLEARSLSALWKKIYLGCERYSNRLVRLRIAARDQSALSPSPFFKLVIPQFCISVIRLSFLRLVE
jgi:hypothetical protein